MWLVNNSPSNEEVQAGRSEVQGQSPLYTVASLVTPETPPQKQVQYSWGKNI